MRERRTLQRVYAAVLVFALSWCALTCVSAASAATPSFAAMPSSASMPASTASMSATSSVASGDDCVCCGASDCCYAVPASAPLQPVAAIATYTQPHASPAYVASSVSGPGCADKVPKPPSLTELSMLRI